MSARGTRGRLVAALAAAAALAAVGGRARAAGKDLAGAESCATCHQEQAEGFPSTFHGRKTLSNPKLASSCESCHGPGGAHAEDPDAAGKIVNPKKLDAEAVADLCFTCHTNKNVMMWKTSHHAQQGLSCLKCHSVHDGNGRRSLKKESVAGTTNETETCLQCHKKQKSDMRLASHHPMPEGEMSCTSCHNPHGGIDGNLKADSVNELCARCHVEKAGPYANEHPPVAESCLNCHKPHGSANDKLLKQAMPYLCLSCHKFPHTATQNGFTGVAISRAEQRGSCADCHKEIHGSDRKATFKD